MEFNELVGLNFKIMDKQHKLVEKYDEKVNILNLYPEYKIKGSYTSYSPLTDSQMKLFHLFPFFNNIIVDIEPYKNEKIFKQHYGMDVNDLMELHLKRKIFFRLPYVPQNYFELKDDYLDEILYTNPPCSSHANYSHGLLINHNDENQLKDINLFDSLNYTDSLIIDRGEFDPLSLFAINMVNNYSNKISNYSDNYYLETNKEYLRKLWSCGFNNLINDLTVFLEKDKNRLDLSLVYAGLYSKCLSDPILESLDGTHLLNYRFKDVSNELNYRKSSGLYDKKYNLKNLNFENSDILNTELIKIINERVEFPLLNSLESYEDIDYDGAKKALHSLDKEISKKNPNNIQEYIFLLNEELLETKIAIENSYDSGINFLNKVTGHIGLIGKIGSLFSSPEYKCYFEVVDLISGLAQYGINSQKFKHILDKLSKLNKPNHIIFFFDYKDKIIINNCDYDVGSNFTSFNDIQTKKYLYYEYLLDKIPSLKEYIAISSQEYIDSTFSITLQNNKEWTEELFSNFQKYITPSILKKYYEHLLTYGIAYQVINHNYQTDEKEVNIINPKYIRPEIINNDIKYYKMIKNGNEIKISPKNASMNIGMSFIESNINYLDMMYPTITKKDNRIKLKWDLFQIEEEKLQNCKTPEESLELLEKLLEQSKEFRKNYYLQIKVLKQMGDIYYSMNNRKSAMKYYKEALDILSKCKSPELKNLEQNIKNKIENI